MNDIYKKYRKLSKYISINPYKQENLRGIFLVQENTQGQFERALIKIEYFV